MIQSAVFAIVVAAGKGTRMGAGMNKVLLPLCGEPVIRHSVRAFSECGEIDGVIVVAAREEVNQIREALLGLKKIVAIVPGGETRQASVQNGLNALPESAYIVLIHDGARPLISNNLIRRCVEQTKKCGSAVVCTPVTDTIKEEREGLAVRTLDRNRLRAVQTPQCFHAAELKAAYEAAQNASFMMTDDASVMEYAGKSVFLLENTETNIKITHPEDMHLAESLIREKKQIARIPRVGIGYDVHRLVPGRKLILCGKEIPWDLGLEGHSDADVALHALMDALLGAACLGDIGRLYPDQDPAYEGVSSMLLLRDVLRRIRNLGFEVLHADVTIIAQSPKLSPYMEEMRNNLLREIPGAQINVKATTTEHLGFEGRKEGISAQAAATIW